MSRCVWFIAVGWLAFACSSRVRAEAHDAQHHAAAESSEGSEMELDEDREEEEEPPLDVSIDIVAAFGKVPAISSETPLTGEERAFELSKAVAESIVVTGGYELGHHFGAEVRVPLTFGHVASRSAFALGNIEIEGEYGLPLSASAQLNFELGVALPLAQGREVPLVDEIEEARGPTSRAQRNQLDRGAVLRAAASARGFEDEALFEIDRLGIVPKIDLKYRSGRFLFGPYVKVENLLYTGSEEGVDPIIELLIGTYVGYEVTSFLDIRARAWCDLALVGGESIAAVEPQVTAHFGAWRFALGAVVPFAGVLTDPQFVGIRFVAGARI